MGQNLHCLNLHGNLDELWRLCRVPEECPQEVSDLISWCRKEPNKRPSALEVFEALNASPMVPPPSPPPLPSFPNHH